MKYGLQLKDVPLKVGLCLPLSSPSRGVLDLSETGSPHWCNGVSTDREWGWEKRDDACDTLSPVAGTSHMLSFFGRSCLDLLGYPLGDSGAAPLPKSIASKEVSNTVRSCVD